MLQTDNQSKTGSGKISEALELLNEAAREKKEELKGALSDRYQHIRQALSVGTEQGKEIIEKAKQLAADTITKGEKKIKEAVSEVDTRAHKDPWPYIAGAAVVSLILGFFMGSKAGIKHK